MKRIVRRVKRFAWGKPGASKLTHAFRLTSVVCLIAAMSLLAAAVGITLNQGPAPKKLARGVVFNAPLAVTAAPATSLPATIATTEATPETATPPEVTPSPQPTWAVPTPPPTPRPSDAPIARLVVPSIKVSARISVKGVDRNGVMQDPDSWDDVVWYNFTGHPGFGTGNNAVFAGHVDYIRHGPAVFWDLNKLKPGDDVHVMLQDGTDYTYKVTRMAVYDAEAAPVDEIIGETPSESVTLITCNGTFSAGHYNNRLVVRAERPIDRAGATDQISSGN